MNIGTKFENQIIHQLESEGYVAVRTHLSRIIDVIAYSDCQTLFIEAKATRKSSPRSYAKEIRNTLSLCRQNGCRDTFMFVIRLRGNKQIWLNLNKMELDDRTTYDKKMSTSWLNRKKAMLKRYS